MSDFNNFNDSIKNYNPQQYTYIDGVSGTTIYTGVSIFNNINNSTWSIKKEWQVGNVKYMGYPSGDTSYEYVWNNRASYDYC